jgi:hypothetical protein
MLFFKKISQKHPNNQIFCRFAFGQVFFFYGNLIFKVIFLKAKKNSGKIHFLIFFKKIFSLPELFLSFFIFQSKILEKHPKNEARKILT